MRHPVTILSVIILAEMVIGGVNRTLAPFVDAFYEYGLYLSIAFIAFLWGVALDERLHRMDAESKDQEPQGSKAFSLLRFGR